MDNFSQENKEKNTENGMMNSKHSNRYDIKETMEKLNQTNLVSNIICVIDIFIIDLFPKFYLKNLYLFQIFFSALYNLMVWNIIRFDKNILLNNKNHIITTRLLYFMIIYIVFIVITFIYNYVSLLTLDERTLNEIYFQAQMMFTLLNIITIFYLCLNILIPISYIINLIELREAFLEVLNSNFTYFKAQKDSSIVSNNSNISSRNPSDSLDIIDKSKESI